MKEKIEQLAKEKFEYQMPKLCIEPEKLIIRTQEGSAHRGTILLTNSAGRRMKGVAYTDNLLLALEKEQFVGREARIPFVFHAEYGKAGDHLAGKLSFVTDAGEETLPYEVQIDYPALSANGEDIKDLFQFASLAKGDWDAAEKLFFVRGFEKAIFYHDRQYELLHRVLSETGRRGQAMEEFLVATGKKVPVSLHFDRTELSYEAAGYDFKDSLTLSKSGWGYVEGMVSCDAPFVQLGTTHFDSADFVDGNLLIEFVVGVADAPPGRREAVIRLSTGRQELKVNLVCAVPHRKMEQHRQRQAAKKALCGLMRTFLSFYCVDGSAKLYAEKLEGELSILQGAVGEAVKENAVRLLRVYFWQLLGREGAAKDAFALLKEEELAGEGRLLGFYYYLSATQKQWGQKNGQITVADAAERVRGLLWEHPGDGGMFWLLLLLKEDYRDRRARFEAIREFCLEYGYHVLPLAEAVRLLRADATLLLSLSDFELHVLKLALSCGLLDGELTRRIAYLAAREKGFFPLFCRVMKKAYQTKQDDELLLSVCTLLIRDGHIRERDFPWFKHAMERQLKLTGLEEFYMYCRSEEEVEPIHPGIFLYFSHGCKLDDRKKAMLYAELIRNRRDHAQLYPKYQRSIEAFAAEQLGCGAVTPNLAVIYNEVYKKQMEGEELLSLPKIAFVRRLCVNVVMDVQDQTKQAQDTFPEKAADFRERDRFVHVQIYHPGINLPVCLPVVEGEARLSVYTSDAEIFLVDKEGCFYPAANLAGTKPGEVRVEITPLVRLDKHLWESYECGASDLSLLMHLKEEENKYLKYGSQPQELSRLLSGNMDVSEELRDDCIRFLMEYYYENYESDLFEHYLKQVKLEGFSKKERARIIHFFILRGFDGRAAQALMQFGTDEIEIKRLGKFALRYLEAMDTPAADAFLLYLAHYIFECGRCDRELISYLCGFYHGATEAMYAIWKSARAQELDTESLEESLLGQMLFAQGNVGNAQAVFLSYYRYGTNRKLIRAFLNYYAYRFLLNDRVISAELFELMEREVSLGDNEICTLALLKRYAQEEGLTQRQKDFLEHKLSGIQKKGIILPFFKRFEEFMQFEEDLYDKTFVEYHTDPSHHVVLHYRIGDAGEFSEREMRNICHGIFIAGFVLFGEESMQYYITEEYEGQTVITESTAVVSADGTTHDGKNHYDVLNLILAAHAMRDDTTVMKLLENYIRTEYEAKHLFHIRV